MKSLPMPAVASFMQDLPEEDDFFFLQAAETPSEKLSFEPATDPAPESHSAPEVAGVNIPDAMFQAFFKSV